MGNMATITLPATLTMRRHGPTWSGPQRQAHCEVVGSCSSQSGCLAAPCTESHSLGSILHEGKGKEGKEGGGKGGRGEEKRGEGMLPL